LLLKALQLFFESLVEHKLLEIFIDGKSNVESIQKFIESKLEASPERTEYEKILAVAYVSNEDGWRIKLSEYGIKLMNFQELMKEILRTIDDWKRRRRNEKSG